MFFKTWGSTIFMFVLYLIFAVLKYFFTKEMKKETKKKNKKNNKKNNEEC